MQVVCNFVKHVLWFQHFFFYLYLTVCIVFTFTTVFKPYWTWWDQCGISFNCGDWLSGTLPHCIWFYICSVIESRYSFICNCIYVECVSYCFTLLCESLATVYSSLSYHKLSCDIYVTYSFSISAFFWSL